MARWFIGCRVVNLNDGRIGENRSHHVSSISSIGLMTRSFNRLHFLFPITPASPVIVLSSEKFPLKPGKGVPTKDKLANEVDLGLLLIDFIFRCNRLSLQNSKFTLKLSYKSASCKSATVHNVHFGLYVFLPTEQAETYLKSCVLINHSTYICLCLFGWKVTLIFKETVTFKL